MANYFLLIIIPDGKNSLAENSSICELDQQAPGGRLSEDLGAKLFAIGSYVGETFVKKIPGTIWRTDDTEPEGELSAEIVLPNGTVTWLMQKVLKRLQNGEEDSIYSYMDISL